MKKWIKNINNQIYLFGLVLITLPLLLISELKSLPGIITLCLWIFAVIFISFIKFKLDKNENPK